MSRRVHDVDVDDADPEGSYPPVTRSNSVSRVAPSANGKRRSLVDRMGGLFGRKGSGLDADGSRRSSIAQDTLDVAPATPSTRHGRLGQGTTPGGRYFGGTGMHTPVRDAFASPRMSLGGSSGAGEVIEEEEGDYEAEDLAAEELEQIEASITCMALHPTEPIIAIGCSPDIIKVWNIKAHKFDAGASHSGRLTAMAFSADGRTLCTAASWESPAVGWTHSMRLWAVDRKTHALSAPPGMVGQEDLEASADEMDAPPVPNLPRLSGNAIRLALQSAIQNAEANHQTLNASVAAGLISQGVMEGKATTEDLLSNAGAPPLQNLHQDQITCVAFMPLEEHPCIKLLDENGVQGVVVFASASQDRTVRIWAYDRMGDATVHVLRQHQAEVTCVSWSPDGYMLMSGSLDGSVICWRISLEPVYESPKGTGSSGLVNPAPTGSPTEADTNSGRMVSCVPIIIQNLKFDCWSSSPHHPVLEPVYCLQFFPAIHVFGRYPEYTVAIGTSGSLLLLRAHSMRVHESPLTNIPEFLRVARNLHRHRRIVKPDKTTAEALAADDEDEASNPAAALAAREKEREKEKWRSRTRGLDGSASKHSEASKNLGLRPNFLQLSELHRQSVDAQRHGAIRSLACGIHTVERHVAYDLEDSLASKHLERELIAVREKQIKVLLTNHEHQGHTLAWVLNEQIDERTSLPILSTHFAVLGKQNRADSAMGSQDDDSQCGRFIGNFCEQVMMPSLVLRKKFDRYSLQREGAAQIMVFTLNCNKDDGTAAVAVGATAPHDRGNGVWALRFNVEASVDFPGDLEPTIASKLAYEAMLAEANERRAKGQGGESTVLSMDRNIAGNLGRPLGNADEDFVGHLAHGYEIEFDLPAFVAMLHPMGTTMNEAMRLAEHQRVMGVRVFKYPKPKKVFEDSFTATTQVKGKHKLLTTLDTSGFATADDTAPAASAAAPAATSSSSAANDATEPGLASSHQLYGLADEAAGFVAGKKKAATTISYKLGSTKQNTHTTLEAAASATRARRVVDSDEEGESDDGEREVSDEEEGSSSRSPAATSAPVVTWQSSVRSSSSSSSSSVAKKQSNLAAFSAQALVDLAPKQKAGFLQDRAGGFLGGIKGKLGADGKDDPTQGTKDNARGQCATPKDCIVQ